MTDLMALWLLTGLALSALLAVLGVYIWLIRR
jgi:hypothetical protein